ncbi:MAG: hypothetical protein ACYS74_09485 [Planctomycetota bacterium]|jgi:hypothetical protein
MVTNHYILLLACSVLLTGCWRAKAPVDDHVPEKGGTPVIKIESLEMTDKTFTLDYHVSNPSADDIYVCEAGCVFDCLEEAGTGIDGETLWITRRSREPTDTVTDTLELVNPPGGVVKYLRLRPGEAHSWRIVLDLPIMKWPSGVFSVPEERAKKRKQIVLHRAIFAVGYFPPRYNRRFVEASEEGKKLLGIKDGDTSVVSRDFGLSIDPYVVDEIHEGKSRQVLYISRRSPSKKLEESETVVITDVNIPCSVPIDDQ